MSDERDRATREAEDDRPTTEPPTEDTMTDELDDERSSERSNETDDRDGRDLRDTLNYALLAGLALLALFVTLRLYFNVSSAINQWIAYEYRSLFQAGFNLAVLLLLGAGMVWQVRNLRE